LDKEAKSNNPWLPAFIGLGSNYGERLTFVQQAMQLLKDYPGIEVVECSSLYETEPVGSEYIEWFVNAVSHIETNLSAKELLNVCQEIEKRLAQLSGNESFAIYKDTSEGTIKSRIIDLDILFYGEEEIETSYLKIPHPYIERRAYALVPLLEIAPDLRHPGLNKTVAEIHDELVAPEQVFLYGTRDICIDL
jgi:2-amino-4-hydroxy-6-hydroxymethyldihydropteridine diphosphokinase